MFKTVTWNTASAAERWRFENKKKLKKNKVASSQALKRVGPPNKEPGFKPASLTVYKQ